MSPNTSSIWTQNTSKILCYHFNSTCQIKLIRLWNGDYYSWEKIFFPQQRILFEAKPEEVLEVNTRRESEYFLEEIFFCHDLQVYEPQQSIAVVF